MLLSLYCSAQEKKTASSIPIFQDSIAGTSFFLKDQDVIYQKVFTSSLKKEELIEKVNSLLSTIRKFRFNNNSYLTDAEFYGRIAYHNFDVRKYDYSLFNNSGYITVPLNAIVAIQVKDYKYRVTISEMNFRRDSMSEEASMNLNEVLMGRNRDKLKHNKANSKLTKYLNQELTTLFDADRSLLGGDF